VTGHIVPRGEGRSPDLARARTPVDEDARARCRPVPQDAPDGGARVLVGLAVFKTADGPHGSWWVRFPLPSAILAFVLQGFPQIRPPNCLIFVSVLASGPLTKLAFRAAIDPCLRRTSGVLGPLCGRPRGAGIT